MLVERFWSNTDIEQQKQPNDMFVKTDPLDKPLSSRPIRTGWELSIEPYRNWHLGCIDDPDHVFGDGSVPTQTRICR